MATVNDNDPRVEYSATASQTTFTRPFFLNAEADLLVYANGVLVTSGYTHTGVGANTGTIVFSSGRTVSDVIILTRATDPARTSVYTNGQPIPASSLEDDNTRALLLEQERVRDFGRSLRAPVTDTGIDGTDLELPAKATRASKYLMFDATGNVVSASAGTGADTGLREDLADTTDTGNGAALIGFKQHGLTGAVARTLHTKGREVKSAADFGAVGDGTVSQANMLTYLTAAWASALANDHDLYFPAGTYELGDANFPWRQTGTPVTLLDCGNVTLYCDGSATIFKTASVSGADVFQLNGLKNFHVRGFPKLTATVSGSDSGSNGVSITNGWDNITLEVMCENLESLDKTSYVDGGKALTIQSGTTVNECGTLKAVVFAKGCSEGFGFEPDLVTSATKRTAVDVHVIAEDCFYAVKSVAGAASGALSASMTSGVRVRGQAINCQKAVVLNRAHGIDIDIQVVSTKTAAAKRLDPNGVAWYAADAVVEGLLCTYAKNASIRMTGNAGACDYKARIGGTTAGSSGLSGASQYCDIFLDLGGTAATSNITAVDSGGNTLANSRLVITGTTATSIPSDFLTSSKANEVNVLGSYGNAIIPGNVRFPAVQVSSSDVNTLDDYEEGTFNPVLADTGLADEGATYALRYGNYTKKGNEVSFSLYIGLSALGTLTGGDAAFILGLPFTNPNVSGNIHACSIGFASGLAVTAGDVPTAAILANTNYITLYKWPAAGTAGTSALTIDEISADGVLVISGVYRVAT